MTVTQAQAVRNGVRLLDRSIPGWRGRLKGGRPFTEADMRSTAGCVLGRLNGWDMVDVPWLADYGFNPASMRDSGFATLARAWNKELGLK